MTLFCQNACKNIIFVLPWPQCLFHFEVGQRFAVPLKHNGVVHVRFARVLKLQFWQIHFVIWTNTFCNFDEYILQFRQIHFAKTRHTHSLCSGLGSWSIWIQYYWNIKINKNWGKGDEHWTVILKTCRQWKDPKPQIQYKKSWPKITGLSVCSFFYYCLFLLLLLFVCYCCMLLLPCCLCAAFSGEPCQRRRCGRTDANPS